MTKNYSPDGDTNRHPEKEMEQAQALENQRDETDIERQERLIKEQGKDTQINEQSKENKKAESNSTNTKAQSKKNTNK
jgi:hypothetical protein